MSDDLDQLDDDLIPLLFEKIRKDYPDNGSYSDAPKFACN